MNNDLIIKRTNISFGNEEYEYLNSVSDHPLCDGFIFSKLFQSAESFAAFINELKLNVSDEFRKELCETYDQEYFRSHSLVLMFSDERSGSNRLSLMKAEISDECLRLEIERERGMTMDMAYLFLLYETEKRQATRSAVHVQDKEFVLL
jgi:hypothetical protein